MRGSALRLAFLGMASLVCATPALALMSTPYGWYLEANAGSTHLSGKSYPGNASPSGIGGSGMLGYKFMPYVASEIQYTRYANTAVDAPGGTLAGTDRHYSYGLLVKGILPISDSGFELFAKLGAQRINSSLTINNQTAATNIGLTRNSHSATNAYYGGGLQYYFTPEFAANIQWARAQGNSSTATMDLASGGVSFIFD